MFCKRKEKEKWGWEGRELQILENVYSGAKLDATKTCSLSGGWQVKNGEKVESQGRRGDAGICILASFQGMDINSVHLTWLTEVLMPKPAISSASVTQKMGFQRKAREKGE